MPSSVLGSGIRCAQRSKPNITSASVRCFASTSFANQEAVQESAPRPDIIPRYIGTKQEERILKRHGLSPIGSRRRRAAIRDSDNIPFEQLPYQCFQEARIVLAEDREEKLLQIEKERKRIAAVEARPASDFKAEHAKKGKLVLMKKYLSQLIVQADINDPLIKKRFEDGLGRAYAVETQHRG
jgi:large subunit ribosomal protein L35